MSSGLRPDPDICDHNCSRPDPDAPRCDHKTPIMARSRWGIMLPHQNNFPIRPDNRNIFPIAPRCGEYFPDPDPCIMHTSPGIMHTSPGVMHTAVCSEDALRGGAKFFSPRPRLCLIVFSDDLGVFYHIF